LIFDLRIVRERGGYFADGVAVFPATQEGGAGDGASEAVDDCQRSEAVELLNWLKAGVNKGESNDVPGVFSDRLAAEPAFCVW
jgi:hypothetical protein